MTIEGSWSRVTVRVVTWSVRSDQNVIGVDRDGRDQHGPRAPRLCNQLACQCYGDRWAGSERMEAEERLMTRTGSGGADIHHGWSKRRGLQFVSDFCQRVRRDDRTQLNWMMSKSYLRMEFCCWNASGLPACFTWVTTRRARGDETNVKTQECAWRQLRWPVIELTKQKFENKRLKSQSGCCKTKYIRGHI